MITARILTDSLNGATSNRLTTFVVSFPRWILAEVNTHRVLSRNTASSRAMPVAKQVARVRETPAEPVVWGANQPGMKADRVMDELPSVVAQHIWRRLGKTAARCAERMAEIGVHKQIANRVIEPWMITTSLLSATEWSNFFALRCHRDAQPEIQALADAMLAVYCASVPQRLEPGQWHMPFGDQMPAGLSLETRRAVATARCARLSYETFDGQIDVTKDLALHDSLAASGHWSPFEHVAQAMDLPAWSGNFRGFRQYRKNFAQESREIDLVALLAERRALTASTTAA